MAYKRHNVSVIKVRINEQRRFIQIVIGPRQTGKTTAVSQALEGFEDLIVETLAPIRSLPSNFAELVARLFTMQREYVNKIASEHA